VSLRDVVEALDLQSDELSSYLDPDTGEIITFNEEEAQTAESGDWEGAPAWMKPQLPKIKRALEDERMLELPDRIRIDEWRMMEDFALADSQCRCRAELQSAVHGDGAFRRFKAAIDRLGLEDAWFRFREERFERSRVAGRARDSLPLRPKCRAALEDVKLRRRFCHLLPIFSLQSKSDSG
jgi:hypothetical protein